MSFKYVRATYEMVNLYLISVNLLLRKLVFYDSGHASELHEQNGRFSFFWKHMGAYSALWLLMSWCLKHLAISSASTE